MKQGEKDYNYALISKLKARTSHRAKIERVITLQGGNEIKKRRYDYHTIGIIKYCLIKMQNYV